MRFLAALSVVVLISGQNVTQKFVATTRTVRLEIAADAATGHVMGLGAADFEVTDNGAAQSVRVEEIIDAPLDIDVVLQPPSAQAFTSDDQARATVPALRSFLSLLEERDRLGIIDAGMPPVRTREMSSGAVREIAVRQSSYSAVFDAIALGLLAPPSERRRVIVAFVNGADFRSVVPVEALARLSGELGPALVAVSAPAVYSDTVRLKSDLPQGGTESRSTDVAQAVFPSMLMFLARRTGGTIVRLGDAPADAQMRTLVASLRVGYLITYEAPPESGWHEVRVKARRRGINLRCRDGYFNDANRPSPAA